MKPEDVDTESWWSGFNAGFVYGMVAMLVVAAISLAVAGCKIEQPSSKHDPVDADAKVAEYDTVLAGPSYAVAKVAAAMADNGITLPQVAAYLNTYGYDVVSRANTLRVHWSPAPPGRDAQGNVVPVAYYVANVRIAVGDTAMTLYVPAAVGPVWMRIKAYDGRGMSGAWSDTTVGGTGGLLPGVQE